MISQIESTKDAFLQQQPQRENKNLDVANQVKRKYVKKILQNVQRDEALNSNSDIESIVAESITKSLAAAAVAVNDTDSTKSVPLEEPIRLKRKYERKKPYIHYMQRRREENTLNAPSSITSAQTTAPDSHSGARVQNQTPQKRKYERKKPFVHYTQRLKEALSQSGNMNSVYDLQKKESEIVVLAKNAIKYLEQIVKMCQK